MHLFHARGARTRDVLAAALGSSLAAALIIAVPAPQAHAQEGELVQEPTTPLVLTQKSVEADIHPSTPADFSDVDGTTGEDGPQAATKSGRESRFAHTPRQTESAVRAEAPSERLSPPVEPSYVIQFEMYRSTLVAASGDTAEALMRFTDVDGNPIAGETVAFASDDAGQLIGDVKHHGDGRYSATVISSETVGVSLLTATVTSVTPEITAGALLPQTLGLPAAETTAIELSNASIAADGATQTELTVRVRDAQQRALPGARISVASSDAGQSVGAFQEQEPGVFVASVQASRTVGTSLLTVMTQDIPDDSVLAPPSWWTDSDGGATNEPPAVAGDPAPGVGTLGTIELAQLRVDTPTTTPPASPPSNHPAELAKTGGVHGDLPLGIASALVITGALAMLPPLRRRSLGR